jgi:predicted nucleic acid-binding protein
VSGFLDTSMLVRYLVADSAELAEKATKVIDGKENLLVTDVVILEAAYVLTSVYRIPRIAVIDKLIEFLQKENIQSFGIVKGNMMEGLLLCRPSGRVSFGDAMIWAAAKSTENGKVYTLDEKFPDDGVEIV